ncbi:hypothetical protein EKM02_06230 [Flavobacterium sp. RSP49]|jgi:hypothetical protein|uniref:Uncharacterized protein n=1 Tax=Flavobacterium zhoui TaxID=3230414 RepID=A0ABW6I890_9FLAO|nr:hypothetical protein [Flavobacterium sp. RSP49]RTZ01343.1 hypothetical protein EKM02_06230 [Flavobacterium sp. RSP49]
METKKATIRREETNTFLVLEVGETPLEIILTDDNPNNIKQVFNSLLKELKKGIFEFSLEDEGKDLFQNICTEYIVQLNVEIKAIYDELVDYELTEEQ